MSNKKPVKTIKRVKTGFLERRMELARAGVFSGTRALTHSAGNLFYSTEKREQRKKKMLSEQAHYFVSEISKLKGSVVKIGQMMALYGRYVLPDEVIEALSTLEEQTVAVSWPGIETALREALGDDILAELEIDPVPLAAASMGQVHKASRISDGQALCIKVQYPGVAKSIDTDFNAVIRLLGLAKLIDITTDMHQWLTEIRTTLHQEVDYCYEAQKTNRVREQLAADNRFVVPEVFSRYSCKTVLTTSFESGISVNDTAAQELPLKRRNHIGQAMLDLFFIELFEWGEMQTDPNFGNYRLRIDTESESDQLVLLDFGAMREFPDDFLQQFRGMIIGAHLHDRDMFVRNAIAMNFMQSHYPDTVLDNFAELGFEVAEPLKQDHSDTPQMALNSQGEYRWHASKLPKRAAKTAGKASLSSYFKLPPLDFMFMMRKLSGVYTFNLVLKAEFNGYPSLAPFLNNGDQQ
ncbi:MAG: AarF/ABC1/UbiB kinase family protein [Pseudomonadales bacterium]|nr:AarF/ABC1/UbiB kinase family protein [Pseudomonadales bacterium]MCP5173090.1 AarF/ABC1/UbiB kinase family protein [Pseudomonadales bacterium]